MKIQELINSDKREQQIKHMIRMLKIKAQKNNPKQYDYPIGFGIEPAGHKNIHWR